MTGGLLLRFLGSPVRAAYLACVVIFLWAVAQFHHADTGFSSLISIGDQWSDSQVTKLRQTPHYVYEKSPGYDGAYYLQIALEPTLENPELNKAIDNLPYRARRILFSWLAWLLGLGRSAWIVQAFALLNVASWLALAVVLLRWFPTTGWENFLRWFAVMFSHGLCMSVRHSLVDAPALLLIALAIRWLEDGKRGAGATTLALAGLGRETSLLAIAALDAGRGACASPERAEGERKRADLQTRLSNLSLLVLQGALIALPLLAWVIYLRVRFGPPGDSGMGNFTLPFAGFAEKARAAGSAAFGRDTTALHGATLAVVIALAVQWCFFATRWQPANRWWRLGAAFACLFVFLATPVWEGYPGAATRVLLPMTLAFNVLVPRGARWLPLLLAGNLTVVASVFEFSPPHEFYILRGDREVHATLRVIPASGWHGPERHLGQHWRWSSGRSELRFENGRSHPVLIAVRGHVNSAVDPRKLRVSIGEKMIWADELDNTPQTIQFGFTAPPGVTVLTFTTDQPPRKVGSDPRELAFMIANLEISVRVSPR